MYQNHPTKNHESFFLKLGILINREHEPDLWVDSDIMVNLKLSQLDQNDSVLPHFFRYNNAMDVFLAQ